MKRLHLNLGASQGFPEPKHGQIGFNEGLFDLLDSMTYLESLSIQGIPAGSCLGEYLDSGVAKRLFRRTKNITHLDIRNSHVKVEFVNAIGALLPRLQHIELSQDCGWEYKHGLGYTKKGTGVHNEIQRALSKIPSLTRIDGLHIADNIGTIQGGYHDPSPKDVSSLLSMLSQLRNLRALDLGPVPPMSASDCQRFVDAILGIEALSLEFWIDNSELINQVLKKCKRLHTLEVKNSSNHPGRDSLSIQTAHSGLKKLLLGNENNSGTGANFDLDRCANDFPSLQYIRASQKREVFHSGVLERVVNCKDKTPIPSIKGMQFNCHQTGSFTNVLPNIFNRLVNLQSLRIRIHISPYPSQTDVTGNVKSCMNSIATLRGLRKLIVDGFHANQTPLALDDFARDISTNCKQLEVLAFSYGHNYLTDVGLSHIVYNLRALKCFAFPISVGGSQVSDKALVDMSKQLTQLEHLRLNHTHTQGSLSDRVVDDILVDQMVRNLRQLKTLQLTPCGIRIAHKGDVQIPDRVKVYPLNTTEQLNQSFFHRIELD